MPASDARRIVIHAGFHKTGTTTVQRVLHDNRNRLAPYVQIFLKPDIPDLCRAAIDYARTPSDAALAQFRMAATASFGALPADDPRPVLVSAEDLCGPIPGRRGRIGYDQAPILIAALIAALPAQMRPHIYLSIRATDPWLRSCYAHHLRHSDLRTTEAGFMQTQSTAPALADIAAGIAAHLGAIPVTTCALEQISALPQGPLTPLLDLTGVPPDRRDLLRPHRKSNPSLPPDILAQFLVINRSEPDSDRRNTAKQALVAAHRKGQT